MQSDRMGIETTRSWSLIVTALSQGCDFWTFWGTMLIIILKCTSQFIQFFF